MGGKTKKDSMEQTVQDILEIVIAIKDELGTVQDDVSILKADFSTLKSDVSILKSDVSGLKSDLSGLRHEFEDFRTETRQNFSIAQQERNRIEDKVDTLKKHTIEDINMLVKMHTS